MKLAVGYDRTLAEQFFRRTLFDIYVSLKTPEFRFTSDEIDYVARQLSINAALDQEKQICSLWFGGDLELLAKESMTSTDRAILQNAEYAANYLLAMEGMVARAGSANPHILGRKGFELVDRASLASTLYRNASRWPRHADSERCVLRDMSKDVVPWINVLSHLPGRDLLESLADRGA